MLLSDLHAVWHLCCAFLLLLSFIISTTDTQCSWWACSGLISIIGPAAKLQQVPGFSSCVCWLCLCCTWHWGVRAFSEQNHCFGNFTFSPALWNEGNPSLEHVFLALHRLLHFLLCPMYSQSMLYFLRLPCAYAQCMANLVATNSVMWKRTSRHRLEKSMEKTEET